ncbi:hypothetical protein OH77DRAFT_787662 [Trametes cingulata]|nr:hypothetical protein OH77DRAFT_787662 [Trametes cingulata]
MRIISRTPSARQERLPLDLVQLSFRERDQVTSRHSTAVVDATGFRREDPRLTIPPMSTEEAPLSPHLSLRDAPTAGQHPRRTFHLTRRCAVRGFCSSPRAAGPSRAHSPVGQASSLPGLARRSSSAGLIVARRDPVNSRTACREWLLSGPPTMQEACHRRLGPPSPERRAMICGQRVL